MHYLQIKENKKIKFINGLDKLITRVETRFLNQDNPYIVLGIKERNEITDESIKAVYEKLVIQIDQMLDLDKIRMRKNKIGEERVKKLEELKEAVKKSTQEAYNKISTEEGRKIYRIKSINQKLNTNLRKGDEER